MSKGKTEASVPRSWSQRKREQKIDDEVQKKDRDRKQTKKEEQEKKGAGNVHENMNGEMEIDREEINNQIKNINWRKWINRKKKKEREKMLGRTNE